MRTHLIGTVVLALGIAACGNAKVSGGPAAAPLETTATTQTPTGKTTTTGAEQTAAQSGSGQALPGAGSDVEATGGGGRQPPPRPLLVPTPPHPINTGDPCGPCNPPPGRK